MSMRMVHALLALTVTVTSFVTACAGQYQEKPGPSAAQPLSGANDGPPPDAGRSVPESGKAFYVYTAHGFRITCPKGFVVRPQDAATLSRFTPAPAASIFFMNPAMASGDMAGIEPPDLAVRIYQAGSANLLKNWLVSGGFVSPEGGTDVQPYPIAGLGGLKVCQSTLIAPGCSFYLLHKGRVYQLTAMSREGEAMIRTFTLLP